MEVPRLAYNHALVIHGPHIADSFLIKAIVEGIRYRHRIESVSTFGEDQNRLVVILANDCNWAERMNIGNYVAEVYKDLVEQGVIHCNAPAV